MTVATACTPQNTAEVARILRSAASSKRAVCIVGGETSLGLAAEKLASCEKVYTMGLNQIVDFPARDMTITLETGVTLAKLDQLLATESQWLPLDAPDRSSATVGGLIAAGFSGARRLGYGRVRDYVLGITAVDGRGVEFHAGGRVVKNVAGYDLCKLLTGSRGSLAAITQVTLRTRPKPECSLLLVQNSYNLADAESHLNRIAELRLPLMGCELESRAREHQLLLLLEGTKREVQWLENTLRRELTGEFAALSESACETRWQDVVQSTRPRPNGVSIKLATRPSQVGDVLSKIVAFDGQVETIAHALSGVVYAHFAGVESARFTPWLLQELRPTLQSEGGHVEVLAAAGLGEVPPSLAFGDPGASAIWAREVKAQFDPHGILSRGEFFGGVA